MSFNKRASLEISIQAIVIVVLAMTLLGLGLGFIKGLFGNINKISEGTFSKVEEQLQNTIAAGNEKLVFSQSKIVIERGKSTLLGWGVKNENNYKMYYYTEFTPIRCPGTCPSTLKSDLNTKWFTFNYIATSSAASAPYNVGAAENQVVRADLNVPRDAQTGLYLVNLKLYDNSASPPGAEYASTDIFITIS